MKVSTSCFFRYYRRISNFYRLYKMLYLAYTKIMPVIFRESLKKLIVKINKEKDELKRNGIMVDGVLYTVKFKGVILLYN